METDQPVSQTEIAEQQLDSVSDLEDDAEDVVFICIHGQAFQCKPQVGIPIKEFKRKSTHTGGSCSCSRLPNITGEKQQKDDKKRKFACDECGRKFSQKTSADCSRTVQNDKDEDDVNGANEDTEVTQQITERMDHNLDPSQQHQQEVREDSQLSCQECGKTFTRQRALTMHIKQHKIKNGGKNSQSGIFLRSRLHLPPTEDHSSYCQMQLFACEECPKVFDRLYKLRAHSKRHLNTKNQSNAKELKELTCIKCFKVFSRPEMLQRHELEHAKVAGKDVMCVLCLETFEDKIVYKAHEKKHLKQIQGNKMKCEVCQKVIKRPEALQRHTELHNSDDKFPCRLGCGLFFASSAYRTRHETMRCKMGEKFLCSICGEVFSSKHQFQVHEEECVTKAEKKEYHCSYCDQVFDVFTAFRRHERIHTHGKPFKCRFCPKAFRKRTFLTYHERIHTKEKPFQCELCGKTFSQNAHRRTHMRVHTGEKPYQCQICEQKFAHSGTLKLHEKSHANPRRRRSGPPGENKCQYCGKIFTLYQSLTCHERIHTNEKPFECNICGKTFRQHAHLQTHKLTHTGEKPHKCKLCGKAFALKGNCTAHERTHDKTSTRVRRRKKASRSASKTSDGTAAERSNKREIQEDDMLTQEGEQVTVHGHEIVQRITVQHPEEDVQGTAIILQLLESAW